MKKVIVYGSNHWGGCAPVKEFLLQNNVKFAYVDINESLVSLKRFLKIRDTNPQFEEVKAAGRVGLPTIVVEDQVYIDLSQEELEKIVKNINE